MRLIVEREMTAHDGGSPTWDVELRIEMTDEEWRKLEGYGLAAGGIHAGTQKAFISQLRQGKRFIFREPREALGFVDQATAQIQDLGRLVSQCDNFGGRDEYSIGDP